MSTAKIQAAIDALPHATGGEWKVKHVESTHETRNGTPEKVWAHFVVNSTAFGGVPVTRDYLHRADVTLIAAAKDLAEEVVRLRGLVKEAYKEGWIHGAYVESVAEAHDRILEGFDRRPHWEMSNACASVEPEIL